jgi:ubiquinone/menaquinone biosynthesis C-methylase UbiE
MTEKIVADNLKSAYDAFYTKSQNDWRQLGAKYKAENIKTVCEGRSFDRVLECGAGDGSILSILSSEGFASELYAIEISSSAIERMKSRDIKLLKEVKEFDGYHIPYPDNFFDMVYCSHVIEHVEHPRLLLREIRRVSKFQVFEIPLDYSIDVDAKFKLFLSYGHINIFTPSTFKFLIKSEGFEVLKDKRAATSQEVIEYNTFINMKVPATFINKLKIKLVPVRRLIKRLRIGGWRMNEFGYNSYTCLCEWKKELTIMSK